MKKFRHVVRSIDSNQLILFTNRKLNQNATVVPIFVMALLAMAAASVSACTSADREPTVTAVIVAEASSGPAEASVPKESDSWSAELASPSGDLTASECDEKYTFYRAPYLLASKSPHGRWSAGTLEQQVLDDDTIVHAEVLRSEFKFVETGTAPLLIRSFFNPPYYDKSHSPKYTTVKELELEVIEYLTGGGADRITAIFGGQVGFDDWAARHCAKTIHERRLKKPLEIDEGIAYLKSTSDPDVYFSALTLDKFPSVSVSGQEVDTSGAWLHFVGNGEFYNRTEDDWVTIDDLRDRIAVLAEEYGRYGDDEKWRECVRGKHFSHDWRPGMASRGMLPIPDYLPTKIINLIGTDTPISSGSTIWRHEMWQRPEGLRELDVRLAGPDADRFEITQEPHVDQHELIGPWQFELIQVYNIYSVQWNRQENANWHGVRVSPVEWITAIEDLPQGTYRFTVEVRAPDFVDCGQRTDSTDYIVVVPGHDGPTKLPPPPRISIREKTSEHVVIDVLPVDGATKYLLSGRVSKIDGFFEPLAELTEGDSYTIKRDELECGRRYYVGAQSFGDGRTYIEHWGESLGSRYWIDISINACVPERHRQ